MIFAFGSLYMCMAETAMCVCHLFDCIRVARVHVKGNHENKEAITSLRLRSRLTVCAYRVFRRVSHNHELNQFSKTIFRATREYKPNILTSLRAYWPHYSFSNFFFVPCGPLEIGKLSYFGEPREWILFIDGSFYFDQFDLIEMHDIYICSDQYNASFLIKNWNMFGFVAFPSGQTIDNFSVWKSIHFIRSKTELVYK